MLKGFLGKASFALLTTLAVILIMAFIMPVFAEVGPGELEGYEFPAWVNLTKGDMFFVDGDVVFIIANISCADNPGENICNSSMTVDANFSQIGGSEVRSGVFVENGTNETWAIFEFNDTVDLTSLSVQQIQAKNVTMNATIFNATSAAYEYYDLPSLVVPVLLVNMSTFGCPPSTPSGGYPMVPGYNISVPGPVGTPVQAEACTQNATLCALMDLYGPGTWDDVAGQWKICAPTFGGATTNLTEVAATGNFSSIANFTLDVPGKAKISYLTNVSFDTPEASRAVVEFAMKSIMGAGRIGINATEYSGQNGTPNLNLTARLTIYNVSGMLGLSNPQIMRSSYDGSSPQSCGDFCSNIVWDGENLTFTVSSFSTYTVTDAINVTLASPGNNNWTNARSINFTYVPVWNNSMTMSNCTLYGNFSGTWGANNTNSSPLSNGASNIIEATVNDDVSYLWNVECYDNTGLGDTVASNYTVMVDSVAPQWSSQAYITPSNYSPSTQSHFNMSWTDANGISKVFMTGNWSGENYEMTNDTYGGSVYNYSVILPAGTWYWLSYANDSTNYTNVSDNWAFTISQAPNPTDLYIYNGTQQVNENVIITYGTQTNVTSSCSVGPYGLYRNGTNVTDTESNVAITLPAGAWEYTANTSGNQNYSSNSTTYYVIVMPSAVNLQLTNNISWSGTYPSPSNTTGYGCPAQITCNLTRNDTGSVSNPDIDLLGVGVYNYTYVTAGNENYTANSISNISVITQGTPSTLLTWNSTSPVNKGTVLNFSSYASDTALATTLYANFSGALEAISTPSVGLNSNVTDTSGLAFGVYQIAANTTGNANYSDNATLETITFTLADIAYPAWSSNQSYAPSNYSATDQSLFNITWADNIDVSNVLITIRNTTHVYISNASMTNDTYGGSIYNYSVVLPAGTYNWTSYANDTSGNWNASGTWPFTINKVYNPVNLYLNGTANDNKTFTYPDVINATAAVTGGTVYIYRNETHISNGTLSTTELIRLGNGTHVYKINATGNVNYIDNETGVTFYAFVNKGTLNLTINFTPTSTVTLSERSNVTGIDNNAGDSDVLYELRRDGSLVANTTPYLESAVLGVGTYNYTFNASSGANWTANASGVWASLTVQSGTSSFVPTGGSGPLPVVTKVTRDEGKANITVDSISSGGVLNITIIKTSELAIRKVSISVVNGVSDVAIRITKLNEMPSTIPYEMAGNVYNYINIEKENITDTDINRTIIRFAVTKTWLADNDIDYSDISLYRWENDEWNELPTTYSFNDSSEMFYEATSPGFSTFAIGTSGAETLVVETECTESWSCTEWSECVDDLQTRTCTDANSCGTTANKPVENQICEVSEAEVKPFPLFEISIVLVLAIVVIVFTVLELTGKLHLGLVRKKSHN